MEICQRGCSKAAPKKNRVLGQASSDRTALATLGIAIQMTLSQCASGRPTEFPAGEAMKSPSPDDSLNLCFIPAQPVATSESGEGHHEERTRTCTRNKYWALCL
eukprot:2035076-Amphidinium_carterae.1